MVKVISLSNEAYGKLKARKDHDKSFSDVIVELVDKKKKPSIMDFFGILKEDKDTLDTFKKVIEDRKHIKLRDIRF